MTVLDVIWRLLVLVFLGQVIYKLHRIDEAVRQDYESAIGHAPEAVGPMVNKKELCVCGHKKDWHRDGCYECGKCECDLFRPQHGRWSSDPPKI